MENIYFIHYRRFQKFYKRLKIIYAIYEYNVVSKDNLVFNNFETHFVQVTRYMVLSHGFRFLLFFFFKYWTENLVNVVHKICTH